MSASRGGRGKLHLDTGVARVRGVVLRPGLVDALGDAGVCAVVPTAMAMTWHSTI
ncbi:hypothetical protein ACFYPB_38590 [Streptomyces olivaceoviridis]|uniref:hypothetical protein n=1 Tax=Streptomyces olivaceoviridis TaxID=1921 RepID=UPI0036952BCD